MFCEDKRALTSNMLLQDLLAAIARNADLPDELAEATPPQVYISPEFLELELDTIFYHEWFCVENRIWRSCSWCVECGY